MLGGGFFGSGAKKNAGNTTNDTKNSVANIDLAGADGFVNSVNIGTTTDSQIDLTVTDGGAIQAMLEVTQGNKELTNNFFQQLTKQSTNQLASIESLATSVSTGGQSILADTSAKMIKYVSFGLGLLAVGLMVSKAVKSK